MEVEGAVQRCFVLLQRVSFDCRKLTCSPTCKPTSVWTVIPNTVRINCFFFKADDLCITALALMKVMAPFLGMSSFLLVCFLLPSSEQCYPFLMPPALHAQNLEGWLFFFLFFSWWWECMSLYWAQSCVSLLLLRKDAKWSPRLMWE